MIVVEKTGEATFCSEVDVFNTYLLADMTFIPLENIFEIWEDIA